MGKYVLTKLLKGNWSVTKVLVVDFKTDDRVYLHGLQAVRPGQKATLQKKGWFGGNDNPWNVLIEGSGTVLKDIHIRNMDHVDEDTWTARWLGIATHVDILACRKDKSQNETLCSPGKCPKCTALHRLKEFDGVANIDKHFSGRYPINTYEDGDNSGIIVDDTNTKNFVNSGGQQRSKWRLTLSDVPRQHASCATCDCNVHV